MVFFIMQIFENVSKLQSTTFKLVMLWEILSIVVIGYLSSPLDEYGAGSPPDIRFGYTQSDFKLLLDAWGVDGRALYLKVALFDMICYAPAYIVACGGLLVHSIERMKFTNKQIVYLILFTGLMDYIETSVQYYLTMSYDADNHNNNNLNPTLVTIGSTANQLKWSTALIVVLLIIMGFIFGSSPSTTTTTTINSSDENKSKTK